jgi:hypothetical protein
LNPHAFALEPESSVSANSTIWAMRVVFLPGWGLSVKQGRTGWSGARLKPAFNSHNYAARSIIVSIVDTSVS